MDIAVIADMFLMRLRSFTMQEMASEWNLSSELDKLEEALIVIKQETFQDREKAAKTLREFLYDVEDILDAYKIECSKIQLLNRKKLLLLFKVRQFFCRINSFAFRVKMGFTFRNLIKGLHRIQRYGTLKATSSIELDLQSAASSIELDLQSEDCAIQNAWTPPPLLSTPLRSSLPQKLTLLTHGLLSYRDVIGRESEKERVLEALLEQRNEAIVSVLPIVGADGIGKTALMKLVYNDERIVNHFQLRIWLNMSQNLSVKKLVEIMIKCASGNRSMVFENYEMDELKIMLERILHNEIYLLVLDDVCNEDEGKWEELKDLLGGGANGSRIVVTTCNESVASLIGTMPMCWLDRLAYEDCLELFLKRVFEQGQEEEHPDLVAIGANIVEKCAGIPLSVNLLGGLLHKKFRVSYWEEIRDHSMWNSQQNGNILPALRVSYDKLPSHLKACLSYCSIFPGGCEIEREKLIQLWMAEGLIQPSTRYKELEHLGLEYFSDLCSRSFFQDVEANNPFFTTRSKMHNLVLDFVALMSETECSMVSSHSQNIFEDVKHVSFLDYDISGKELPSSLLQRHSLRTIFFPLDGIGPNTTSFVDNCISRFVDLRTLDLSHSCFEILPNSIGELKHLKYLDLSGNDSIQTLPTEICNLQSLQTLRVLHCIQLRELPKDIDKLISLRHLCITTKQESFPDKVVGCLPSLRSLSLYSCKSLMSLSEELQYLTNLRTLAIVNCPKLTFLPSSMKYLTALENLKIIDCEELTLFEWQDIEGLKTLRSLVIGGLPELDARDVQCFGNLQSLVIAGLPQLVSLPRWLEGSASTLRNLGIVRCPNFTALPEWLENLSELEKIEISECSKMTSLPEGIQCLNGLKELKIVNCHELSSRCRGEDRAKIAHIPKVFVNGILIQ